MKPPYDGHFEPCCSIEVFHIQRLKIVLVQPVGTKIFVVAMKGFLLCPKFGRFVKRGSTAISVAIDTIYGVAVLFSLRGSKTIFRSATLLRIITKP